MIRLVPALLFMTLVALACHGDRANPHVYSSPPPQRAPSAATAGMAVAEPPLGANGPGASITSVVDAATGTPVSLTNASATLDVMTLVAVGPGSWSTVGGMRVDLAVRGPRDTTLSLPLGSPPPSMMAHAFRLPMSALGSGRYSVRVMLVTGASKVVVESAPLFLTVPD